MSRYYAHDADGAPPAGPDPHAMAVHVRGGIGHSVYDTGELREIEARLDDVVRATSHARLSIQAVWHDAALDADLAPDAARLVDSRIDEALEGVWGVARFEQEALELYVATRYARMSYEEAEGRAQAYAPVPSALAYAITVLNPFHVQHTLGRTVGAALLVGRLPIRRPSTTLGLIGTSLLEALNWVIGDDNLPPDAIALDRAVRELGEGGQHIVPWFLRPGPFTYDGRTMDPAGLTTAQRLLVPLTAVWHLATGRRPGSAPEESLDVVAVSPPRPVAPVPDLASAVRALRAVHIDHGAEPGSIEVRRTDHEDGRRTWTVLLPSTQALGLGGANPVDNLTNFETYGGMVSDVEIGAVRAMELAGVAPGEEVAVVGFSQGGLTAMRLAADPLVRSRFAIRTVVTAGSPVGHLPTPEGTDVLNLEHLEDVTVGLDGTSNPAEAGRTTVTRALTTGQHGALNFRVQLSRAHSVEAYAETAAVALASGDVSVSHVDARLREATGGAGARVTATTYRLERTGEG